MPSIKSTCLELAVEYGSILDAAPSWWGDGPEGNRLPQDLKNAISILILVVVSDTYFFGDMGKMNRIE
ncbi:MAG: hypothetical protein HQK60_06490 [Deltaproteobacteria bacterium]|nr:hypothetical protein [Deltaproteobacteria bacterium]